MPSVSNKQRRLMQAAAHNAAFAKKVGISQDVARDFYRADQRKMRRKQISDAITKVRSR